MKTKRRKPPRREAADLFSVEETSVHRLLRLLQSGNYATRTIRRWIFADPSAIDACRELLAQIRTTKSSAFRSRIDVGEYLREELARLLAAWFAREVRVEEPSANYADYLAGSIEVEWGMLADELLTESWSEGS